MVVIQSYPLAVALCFVTMLCWGSWANTQKLASKEWKFQLFYWDYCIGVVLLSLIAALTMGSMGPTGRGFIADLGQATGAAIGFAFLGGVVFNLANILLVAAIDIAGMAVAFPIGIGIALVEGVIINYILKPQGNPILLFAGVAGIAVAIINDQRNYHINLCRSIDGPVLLFGATGRGQRLHESRSRQDGALRCRLYLLTRCFSVQFRMEYHRDGQTFHR